jgi:hypothetical protein
MANCFRCGTYIKPGGRQERRRVKTGEATRWRYPRAFVSSTTHRYGMRVVCASCARGIDRQEQRVVIFGWLQLVGAIVLLLILIVFQLFR